MYYKILPNGLTVIIDNINYLKRVSALLSVNVGVRHDPEKLQGLSHFLEHMVCEGTKTKGHETSVLLNNVIAMVGGIKDAWTNYEYTTYGFTVLKDGLTTGLDVIADMIKNSIIDPLTIEKERKVILEEFNMRRGRPDSVQYEDYHNTVFKGHPIGRTTIGTQENINHISRDDLIHHMNKLYTAANMTLTIVGNVENQEQIVEQIEALFGDITTGVRNIENNHKPIFNATEIREEIAEKNGTKLIIGFPLSASSNIKEDITIQLMTNILCRGQGSRLWERLRIKEDGLVYGVNMYNYRYSDTGICFIKSETRDVNLVLEIIIDELLKISSSDVNDEELCRVKKRYEFNNTDRSSEQKINIYMDNLKQYGRVISTEEATAALNEINKQDIKRVAANIFSHQPTISTSGKVSEQKPYVYFCDLLKQGKEHLLTEY